MAHKVYRGRSDGHDTAADVYVWVTFDDGRIEPLKHHVHHSPTGFNWGYNGGGPADLARSLLWDHLGRQPHPSLYQDFKDRLVAVWPSASAWSMTTDDIQAWIEGSDKRQLAANLCAACGGTLPDYAEDLDAYLRCDCAERLVRAGQGHT